MKNFQRLTLGLFVVLAGAFVVGCSSDGDVVNAGAAGAGASVAPGGGDVTKGSTLFHDNSKTGPGCVNCHGASGEGLVGPNITGSSSAGIGSWSEQEFNDAVRNGKSPTGNMLCMTMPAYPATVVSDADLVDIFAYLKTTQDNTANLGTSGCKTK